MRPKKVAAELRPLLLYILFYQQIGSKSIQSNEMGDVATKENVTMNNEENEMGDNTRKRRNSER